MLVIVIVVVIGKRIDNIYQGDRTEIQETNWHRYSYLIFDKGAKATQWKRIVFSANGVGTTGYTYPKEKRKGTWPMHYTLYKN